MLPGLMRPCIFDSPHNFFHYFPINEATRKHDMPPGAGYTSARDRFSQARKLCVLDRREVALALESQSAKEAHLNQSNQYADKVFVYALKKRR